MQCPEGHPVAEGALFCAVCGTPAEPPATAEPPSSLDQGARPGAPRGRGRGLLIGAVATALVAVAGFAARAVLRDDGESTDAQDAPAAEQSTRSAWLDDQVEPPAAAEAVVGDPTNIPAAPEPGQSESAEPSAPAEPAAPPADPSAPAASAPSVDPETPAAFAAPSAPTAPSDGASASPAPQRTTDPSPFATDEDGEMLLDSDGYPVTVESLATTTAEVRMRATPACDGAELAWIPVGARVVVNGSDYGGWYPVTYQGKSGWTSGAYLQGPPVSVHELLCG